MALSLRFVKEIHARLSVRYGTAWSAKWTGLDMAAIEADWAEQLDGMQPANIRKALESLPVDFPPTAPAFRALGVIHDEHRPAPELPAPDTEGLRRIAQSMSPAVNNQETPAEWMARLNRDVLAGTASPARVRHHRIATENGYYGNMASGMAGAFNAPPVDSLPPAMRAELERSDAPAES